MPAIAVEPRQAVEGRDPRRAIICLYEGVHFVMGKAVLVGELCPSPGLFQRLNLRVKGNSQQEEQAEPVCEETEGFPCYESDSVHGPYNS